MSIFKGDEFNASPIVYIGLISGVLASGVGLAFVLDHLNNPDRSDFVVRAYPQAEKRCAPDSSDQSQDMSGIAAARPPQIKGSGSYIAAPKPN